MTCEPGWRTKTVLSTVLVAFATMVAPGIDAAAGNLAWTVQPTPADSGNTSLDAVSCPSAAACTATGGTYAGASDVQAEHWNGSSWVIQSMPSPGAVANAMLGVSCLSASACTAVGYYAYSDQNPPRTLAEHWNGSTWAVQPTVTGGEGGTLSDVACLSKSFCSAVGVFYASSTLDSTLVQHWNGSSWAIQSTPNPTGAGISALSGISCLSHTFCTAVGVYYPNSTGERRTLAEHWDGSSWTIQSTPNPGTNNSALASVSCSATTACAAVGTYDNASGESLAFAERWDGDSWQVQSIPNPSGTKSSRLTAVSCSSSSSCVAVGSYNRGGALTLAEGWNGSKWTVESTPNPVPSTDRLFGVSCSSATLCTAVGDYVSTQLMTLAERYS